jgi:hypothetical protein
MSRAVMMPLANTAAPNRMLLTASWVMPEMMCPLVQPPARRAPKTMSSPPANAFR